MEGGRGREGCSAAPSRQASATFCARAAAPASEKRRSPSRLAQAGHLLLDGAEVVGDVGDGADGPAERLRARAAVRLDRPQQVAVAGAQLLAQGGPAGVV